jgi:beta-xylosidase
LKAILAISTLWLGLAAQAQSWRPDAGQGRYRNPIVHADYSDPDVVAVGTDYYMTASSFTQTPGLPILHSTDLVHWRIIGHALPRLRPMPYFDTVRHGGGVWAPSIRYRQGLFYIYYPDPDHGIFLTTATDPAGPWSAPVLVEAGKGLIDPCPLWDGDGRNYLVHAYAGSRAGFKSILVIKPLNRAGTQTTGPGVMVFDGHDTDPTVEGPKLYKRNGWYYIFAPAGGVTKGWQLVLRSKSIYGPYEKRVTQQQGSGPINGPHQGAWVHTAYNEDWFVHFQDKGAYGRVVHLQPMQWKNDWPLMGTDTDGDGIGEPVLAYRMPKAAAPTAYLPQEGDEMNGPGLGPQWQWQANPQEGWAFTTVNGYLRMFSVLRPDSATNLWAMPNLLGQKLPAPSCTATAKITVRLRHEGEQAGIMVMGASYGYMALQQENGRLRLKVARCAQADQQGKEQRLVAAAVASNTQYLRIVIQTDTTARFYHSADGRQFVDAGIVLPLLPGKWVGARMGLFCNRYNHTNDAGYMDVDWWRVEGTKP